MIAALSFASSKPNFVWRNTLPPRSRSRLVRVKTNHVLLAKPNSSACPKGRGENHTFKLGSIPCIPSELSSLYLCAHLLYLTLLFHSYNLWIPMQMNTPSLMPIWHFYTHYSDSYHLVTDPIAIQLETPCPPPIQS